MKVVLFTLNSSFVHTNLALRCLASPLTKENIETVIIEKTLKDKSDSVLFELYREKADIYGFSAYIWNIDELLKIASNLHKLLPDTKIVFGGPEVSFEDNGFFKTHKYVDFIIKGEGEEVFLDLCKNNFNSDCRIIQGKPYQNFINEGILYDVQPDYKGSILYYESSRGCPYNCSYCLSSLTSKVRAKGAEKTLKDLAGFENLGNDIQVIKFVDRTFNYDVKRAKAIWRGLLDERYTKCYHFEICADLLDEECFQILSEMPLNKIQFEAGIQSTNPETLEAINRFTDYNKALNNLKRLKQMHNIHIHADLIAGLPYEDYRGFAKSFDETYHCCDMLQLGFLKLLKGSCLRGDAGKYGYKFKENAPYTVLKNNVISFEELNMLKKIEGILNRYKNSGNFERSIDFLVSSLPSPFITYEGLAKSFNTDIEKVSQYKAYEILNDYAKKVLNNNDYPIFKSYLSFDFLIKENKKLPEFLMNEHREDFSELKQDFIKQCKTNNAMLSLSSLEAHRFLFDPDRVYMIDRSKHKYFII